MQRIVSISRSRPHHTRRGSATVELAVVTPIFITLFLGMIEMGISIDASHKLHASLRQAGRLASQDYTDKLQPGQTANDKVIQDIKNQMAAEGIDIQNATVTITHADGGSAGSTFDLSDPDNSLGLFKIEIKVPNSAVSSNNFLPKPNKKMTASIVFRKGQSLLID